MEIEKKYEPELELTQQEVSDLSAVTAHPGFQTILKVARWSVDQFVLEWINASKPEEVLEAHRRAKTAAQFFQSLVDGINYEVNNYREVAISQRDKSPVDSVPGLETGPAVDYLNNKMEDGEEPTFYE